MMDEQEFLIVKILKNDEWLEISHQELRKGDVFKIFDPDNETQIKSYNNEDNSFTALSDIHLMNNGEPDWIECE